MSLDFVLDVFFLLFYMTFVHFISKKQFSYPLGQILEQPIYWSVVCRRGKNVLKAFHNDTGHTPQHDVYTPHIRGSLLEPLENLSSEPNRNFMVLFIAIKPIPKLEWVEMVVFQGSFLTRLMLKGYYPCWASRLSDKFELMTFLGVDVDVRTSFRQSGDGFKFISATEADNRRDFIDDKPPEMDVGNTI